MGLGRIVGMAGKGAKWLGGRALNMAPDLAMWGIVMPAMMGGMGSGESGGEVQPAAPKMQAPDYYIDPNTRKAMQEQYFLQQMAGVNSIAKQ